MNGCTSIVLRLRKKTNAMLNATPTIAPPIIPPAIAGAFDLRDGDDILAAGNGDVIEDTVAERATDEDEEEDNVRVAIEGL